jgi:hypothetical protein
VIDTGIGSNCDCDEDLLTSSPKFFGGPKFGSLVLRWPAPTAAMGQSMFHCLTLFWLRRLLLYCFRIS